MDVGIVASYARTPGGYAAVRLARHFMAQHTVGTFAMNHTPTSLHAAVDRKVAPAWMLGKSPFVTWLARAKPKLVIWTELPRTKDVALASKTGATTILVAGVSSQAQPALRKLCPYFNFVIAPSDGASVWLMANSRGHVIACPWAPFGPHTQESYPVAGERSCYLPVLTHDHATVEAALLAAKTYTVGPVTVAHAGWPPWARRDLKRLRAKGVQGVQNLTVEQSAHLASQHALTLTIDDDPYATNVIAALHAGSPVAAYAYPVCVECTTPGNAILSPHAEGAAALAEKAARAAMSGRLPAMRRVTSFGLTALSQRFTRCWGELAVAADLVV